jgi:hypothetical protein
MQNKTQKNRLLIFTAVFALILSLAPGLGAGLAADLDGNCLVNIEDLLLLAQYWLSCSGSDCPADTDGDSDADIHDFATLADTFNLSSTITATASSQEAPEYPPESAVDGNFATRWSSAFADNQYLILDLGHQREVTALEINWENAYASSYEILLSNDSSDWTTACSTAEGTGGIEHINITPQTARYVKINCIQRATEWGSSIYEVLVKPLQPTCNSPFTLVWQDDFNSFDPSRWEKATHTWNENLAQFVPENVTFAEGIMTLHLTDEPTAQRQYSGAEYRTKDSYLYGKFVVRAKAAPGSGVISSFFTYRDPPDPTWNEIDIEFLGKNTTLIQFNPWWDWWPNCEPVTYDLPYDTADDFHVYTFEWTPDYIRWTVDGDTYHVFRGGGVNLSQKIMMNIWISSNTDWAGPFNPNILPTAAQYDYVEYYRLN